MKENVKDTTKALYTMCICLIVVMGVLFLGNSLTKGTYSAAVTPELDPPSPSSSSSSPSSSTSCWTQSQCSSYYGNGKCGQDSNGCWSRKCGAGEYFSTSRNKCETCTAGYYCEGGTTGQKICPKGFYCPAGSSQKQSCGDGKTTTAEGMDEKSDCVAGETVYKITLMRAEGNDTMTTCDTGTDGKIKIASCKKSPGSICGTWTTEPLKNNTQGGTEITSEALMSKVFTSNVTYYCKGGTSIHPGGNPSNPSNPSKPSSTPSTSSNPPSSSTVTENPKTGSVAIFMVWVIAIGTLIYSIAYFKQSKFE